MASAKSRAIKSALSDFIKKNQKVLICAALLLALGIVIGVISAFKTVDGEFEKVARVDVETGAAKMFFIFLLATVGCYGVIVIAGVNNKTVLLLVLPFVFCGYFFGWYATGLLARFGGFGVTNFVFVYAPYFVCSFVLMALASCASTSGCGGRCADACGSKGGLKASFVTVLKLFAVNVALSILFFLIIGGMTGVIIVRLF